MVVLFFIECLFRGTNSFQWVIGPVTHSLTDLTYCLAPEYSQVSNPQLSPSICKFPLDISEILFQKLFKIAKNPCSLIHPFHQMNETNVQKQTYISKSQSKIISWF